MVYFDMPLDELRRYKPERKEPADVDAFWKSTLEEARKPPLAAKFEAVDFGLKMLETYDVTFNGYGGQPVKGWLSIPAWSGPPLACVVEVICYGGGRGFPTDWTLWTSAGYAHFVMDTRVQGNFWRNGDTPDIPDGA